MGELTAIDTLINPDNPDETMLARAREVNQRLLL